MKVVDGQRRSCRAPSADPPPLRRGPVLVTAAFAALGGALIPAAAVPALWRIWQLYAMEFGAVALVELGAVVTVLGRPTRRTARFAALAATAALALWVLSRPLGLFTRLDPWQPADTVVGFTDYVAAGLQVVAVTGFLVVARRRAHPWPSAVRRVAAWIVLFPVLLLVLAVGAAGTVAASDGIRGTGASALLDGSTVEYCRPDGVPLAMDLARPSASGPSPVALFLHGGGLIAGNRKAGGAGELVTGSRSGPLRAELTAHGFTVASIDYRLAPAAPWPSPLDDARCAVRFLVAHAAALDVDPARITVAGTGAGGTLAALLGVTGTAPLKAVAALSAPADLTGPDLPSRVRAFLVPGRSASPLAYPAAGAPPFLVGNGGAKSAEFAAHLRAAGVPVTEGPVPDRAVAEFLAREADRH